MVKLYPFLYTIATLSHKFRLVAFLEVTLKL